MCDKWRLPLLGRTFHNKFDVGTLRIYFENYHISITFRDIRKKFYRFSKFHFLQSTPDTKVAVVIPLRLNKVKDMQSSFVSRLI